MASVQHSANQPVHCAFAMALSVPHLALRGCRRICARASRARVTPKALLPGRSSPDRETEANMVHSGGVVAATLASLLLVRPSVLLSCCRPGCCHAQRSALSSNRCWDCGNGAWIKCFSRDSHKRGVAIAPRSCPTMQATVQATVCAPWLRVALSVALLEPVIWDQAVGCSNLTPVVPTAGGPAAGRRSYRHAVRGAGT